MIDRETRNYLNAFIMGTLCNCTTYEVVRVIQYWK